MSRPEVAESANSERRFPCPHGPGAAVMAMILSVCGPSEQIILPRNLHPAILTGLVLAGAVPVFMAPDRPQTALTSLQAVPDAKALLLTDTIPAELERIVSLAHAKSIPVLVDLTRTGQSLETEADLVATIADDSTSLLRHRGALVDPDRVRRALALLTNGNATVHTHATGTHPSVPVMPLLARSPRDAFFAPAESVPLAQAVGRVCAETIVLHPPGVPIFLPGEVIVEENVVYLQEAMAAGLQVGGAQDQSMQLIQVVL